MTHLDLRKKFLEFWNKKGHAVIPSSSIVPENDPTTLFTGSGMQPMMPYLLGLQHPLGTRLVDSQKCLRVQDIEEVGDNRHTTFFEMLGNWSFGDYFKKEQLTWYFQFLTDELKIDPSRLYVTVFGGDERFRVLENEKPQVLAPDLETIAIWKELFEAKGIKAKDVNLDTLEKAANAGMQEGRIFLYGVKKNWWSRSGEPDTMPVGEPGGPDSEMFYDFGQELGLHEKSKFKNQKCHPNCDCGRFLEIGNSVFMQYLKQDNTTFASLPKRNVDFGGGLERTLAVIQNDPDIFKTDLFNNLISEVEKLSNKSYNDSENKSAMRIIADHIKAATFLIIDGVRPSNKERGYILRRLMRRAVVKMHTLHGGLIPIFDSLADTVLQMYEGIYFNRNHDREVIFQVFNQEMDKFSRSLDRGLKEFEKISDQNTGGFAFNLFQSYGFPVEITEELLKQQGKTLDRDQFQKFYQGHQELSRTAAAGKFRGGLADHSEMVTKYHTATHLLQAALRQVLGNSVHQEGSNLTAERLRFDFSFPRKLTPEEIVKTETLVNKQIKNGLEQKREIMSYDEAVKSRALAFFQEKYPEKVTVYSFGNFSKEICGGPHVENTKVLGRFKIIKEEAVAAGMRRIYGQIQV